MWRRNRHVERTTGEKTKGPKCINILMCHKTIWDEFPINIGQNSFTCYGYVFEDGLDYSMETESEFGNE